MLKFKGLCTRCGCSKTPPFISTQVIRNYVIVSITPCDNSKLKDKLQDFANYLQSYSISGKETETLFYLYECFSQHPFFLHFTMRNISRHTHSAPTTLEFLRFLNKI